MRNNRNFLLWHKHYSGKKKSCAHLLVITLYARRIESNVDHFFKSLFSRETQAQKRVHEDSRSINIADELPINDRCRELKRVETIDCKRTQSRQRCRIYDLFVDPRYFRLVSPLNGGFFFLFFFFSTLWRLRSTTACVVLLRNWMRRGFFYSFFSLSFEISRSLNAYIVSVTNAIKRNVFPRLLAARSFCLPKVVVDTKCAVHLPISRKR